MGHKRMSMMSAMLICGLLSLLAGCSNTLGLPESGAVQIMQPAEQSTRRIFTNPAGPAKDARPEAIVSGFFDAMPAGVQNDGFETARQFLTGSASNWWNSEKNTLVYSNVPQIVRKASSIGSTTAPNGITVSVRLQIQGELDSHGVYTAVSGNLETYDFILSKEEGQWRIKKLPVGVMISIDDFDQVYRQVALYQLDASRKDLVPDVRWLCWRDWRARTVEELLAGSAQWLRDAVANTNTERVSLLSNGVTVRDSTIRIRLSSAMNRMTNAERSVLVRQLRLSLGDGNVETDIDVESDDQDYSQADEGLSLTVSVAMEPMYTLSAGNIVSLKSSNAVRVAQTGLNDTERFVFSSEGGAVLDHDGRVRRLGTDGTLQDSLFSRHAMRALCKGKGKEIWAVDGATGRILIDDGGKERTLAVPGLADGQHVGMVSVSPEGDRLAFSLESDSRVQSGVGIIGIRRGSDDSVESLARSFLRISAQSEVAMMTFYNDVTLIYATKYDSNVHTQTARRQLVPGPETNQEFPDGGAVAMAAGEVDMYRRLTILDHLGAVKTIDGSLEGSWSIVDSQVTALSAQ